MLDELTHDSQFRVDFAACAQRSTVYSLRRFIVLTSREFIRLLFLSRADGDDDYDVIGRDDAMLSA